MKIVFTGGGSAGHVTPNITLIKRLQGEQLYYIGTDGIESKLLQQYVDDKIISFYKISADKLQRKFTFKNLLLPIKLLRSVRQCTKLLKQIQPDVVFSKGGYVGLPVIIASHKLKIPSIIHENDMSLGLANKLSINYADEFLSAFDCDKRAKRVGLIMRNVVGDKQKGYQTVDFDKNKPLLLVTGGSLGAMTLNNAIIHNEQLSEKYNIFVITGKNKQIDCPFVHQKEYINNMADIYAIADVCLTRAGSNTLAELTMANVPFVTVPLTKCSRGEQVKNAEWFVKRGCGIILNESNLTDKLQNAIDTVYNNSTAFIVKQRETAKVLDGTDKVLERILSYKHK